MGLTKLYAAGKNPLCCRQKFLRELGPAPAWQSNYNMAASQ